MLPAPTHVCTQGEAAGRHGRTPQTGERLGAKGNVLAAIDLERDPQAATIDVECVLAVTRQRARC